MSASNAAASVEDQRETEAQEHPATNPSLSLHVPPARKPNLFERLRENRALSRELAAPLSDEDQTVQACPDASPTKWHLAHTTWFYESFLLTRHLPGYRPYSDDFAYCFNSYYEAKGDRHPRASRGLLTRPTAQEVRDYRNHVDEALERLAASPVRDEPEISGLIELGINHEQQHQELLLTDILALFAAQPLRPAYMRPIEESRRKPFPCPAPARELAFDGGIFEVGHDGNGFSYDNEGPRHEVLLRPFRLADRCVTNAEWLEFMREGGYERHEFWLADGWTWVRTNAIEAPGYWERPEGAGHDEWRQMTLHGLEHPDPACPVSHVSLYEADAFAKWAGNRLATEFEWEVAAVTASAGETSNTLATRALQPRPAGAAQGQPPPHPKDGLRQMHGDVWEWTRSAYLPYPGYRAPEGAVGEYNGKFMCSQNVLRGASCATVSGHSRPTYRNFFYPHQRWQFTGLRVASDA